MNLLFLTCLFPLLGWLILAFSRGRFSENTAAVIGVGSVGLSALVGSTGLGQAVAIPHGRIKGLKEAVAAFVRLAEPVPFDAPDGRPVQLLFFLLVPEQATQQHLDILSELAQMLSDKSFREELLNAPDAQALHAMLQAWEPIRPAA